ncbi:MAG: CDP-archaeol synthase [Candidatus Aenigmarchaeota archaeon]|nr:CDP-archaeol synthase [Candidatus Aenigmarchaeota archaeon]
MKTEVFLKEVENELKDVSLKEKKKILSFLKHNIEISLRKNNRALVFERLGDPTKYGLNLNNYYKSLKKCGKKRRVLKELKFVISSDFLLPVPPSHLWVLGTIFTICITFLITALIYLDLLVFGILLFPLYIANSFAFLSSKIKFLKFLAVPIDLNKKWFDRRRILGQNKTLRGCIFGILGGLTSIIIFVSSEAVNFSIYSSMEEAIEIGLALGFGAIIGDMVKSFFKRRVGKGVGENWFPFDQVDFLLGALAFVYLFKFIPLLLVVILIPVTILTHVVFNILAFYIRIKRVPW